MNNANNNPIAKSNKTMSQWGTYMINIKIIINSHKNHVLMKELFNAVKVIRNGRLKISMKCQ
jgi:hypothetical protein